MTTHNKFVANNNKVKSDKPINHRMLMSADLLEEGRGILLEKKMSADIDKTLLAFLNGLSRRHFFNEEQFTDVFLREEVLNNMSEEGKGYNASAILYPSYIF